MDRDRKIERLMQAARLYYEEDRTQSEIAKIYGISRPMVSKLLKEARELGVVTIRIQNPFMEREARPDWEEELRREFGLCGSCVAADGSNDLSTNGAVSEAAIRYLEALGHGRLGIGWGHIIGDMVTRIEKMEQPVHIGSHICPLIGNGSMGLRNYHSNELVRVMAEHSGAEPEFIYTPACVLSEQEFKLTEGLENYKSIYEAWEHLDVALVNIGNFPSVPDFASEARYGTLLTERRAAGRILNYFVDGDGNVIHSDTDYAIQIPLNVLKKVKHVVGICSANTKPRALKGVLRSGYVNHVIAPEHVVREMLKES